MSQDLAPLRTRFLRSLGQVGATGDGSALFEELVLRYQEPQRYYHTLDHVGACLSALDEFGVDSEHSAEVEIALWFHDVVYDPRRNDNESKSAEFAGARLSALGVASTAIDRIASHVSATAHHLPGLADQEVLLDIDLSILGTTPGEFDCFEKQVRREFAHVPEPHYREGRCRVLTGFLSRPEIYRVPKIRERLEARARSNLERRIDELSCLLP